MKRKSKNNEDLVKKILNGMLESKNNIISNMFAQRLRANIMRNSSKDGKMDVSTITNYLNSISASKNSVREEDVQAEYLSCCNKETEKKIVSNPVIDRMLYKGIERLSIWINKEQNPHKGKEAEDNITFMQLGIPRVEEDDTQEEEKQGIYQELGMIKNNSHQITLETKIDNKDTDLNYIEEDSPITEKELDDEEDCLTLTLDLKQMKGKPEDPDIRQAEQDTDEEATDSAL